MDLTQEQWNVVEALLPADPVRKDGRGRPWSDRRPVLNGVLWILRTGAPWKDLPARYSAPAQFTSELKEAYKDARIILPQALDGYGGGVSSTPWIRLKATVVSAMPTASVPAAVSVNAGWRFRTRVVCRATAARKFILDPPVMAPSGGCGGQKVRPKVK